MTEIIVFGKPRSYESYSYFFGGEPNSPAENIHSEPILKPHDFGDRILHYYVKDGSAGLECYSRVKGYESDRPGIIFGVALKSTFDINIKLTAEDVLLPFWSYFAEALLNETTLKFKNPSIIESLKLTQFSEEEASLILNASGNMPITVGLPKTLLLVAPSFNDVYEIEKEIKGYTEIYISNDLKIFKESDNDVILKKANNEIYEIVGGKIVLIKDDEEEEEVKVKVKPKPRFIFGWGERKVDKGNNDSNESEKSFGKRKKTNLSLSQIIGIVFGCLVIFSLCVWAVFNLPDTNGGDNQSDSGAQTDSSEVETSASDNVESEKYVSVKLRSFNDPINQYIDLSPEIVQNGTTYYANSEISFTVSHPDLVRVDKSDNYKLKVVKRPNNDTKITVTAVINDKEVGCAEYTIKAKVQPNQNSNLSSPHSKQIPPYNGKARSLNEYLGNLRQDLDRRPQFVKEECQKIINGEYGDEYKLNSDAIKLRDEADQRLNVKASSKI